MQRLHMLGAALALFLATRLPAAEAIKLDKSRLESYLRYAEGYTPGVKFVIDDPAPSPFPGFFRVTVHLSAGSNKLDRKYYVTPDGQHLINGAIWDLNDSPFQDTLARLPKDGFSFGPADAKVTLVIFSDFECPYCREFAHTVRENLRSKYPKDVRVIFQDFPLDTIHPWARAAAEAARCVGGQKPEEFWTFHDWIFGHQAEVKAENLREKTLSFVKEQKLDEAKAGACIDGHATAAEVNQSIQAAQILQVQQTPTVFINGRTEPGALSWADLDAVIQLELGRPKEVRGPGAQGGPLAQNCCEAIIPTLPKR